jgi:hypothetical protein
LGEWKGVFVKNNVTRRDDPTSSEVEAAIPAVGGGITKENTSCGAWGEFVRCRSRLVRVAEAPKHLKVRIGHRLVMEEGVWNTEVERLAGAAVEEVGGCRKCLGPVGRWHVRLKKKCASNTVESAQGTFSFAILRGGVRASHAEMYAMACEKLNEGRVNELSAIVSL